MKTSEIATFIEEMENIGDDWTEEQVNEVYGNKTLEEALAERRGLLSMQLENLVKANLYASRK